MIAAGRRKSVLASPSKLFLVALGVLLVGYVFGGRGFAYMGAPPLFIGECVLAIGLLAVGLRPNVAFVFRSPLIWLIVLFGLWGAFRTAPYIGSYGAMALRDAVIWGYAAFAVLVADFLLRRDYGPRPLYYYGRLLPWLFLALPVVMLATELLGRAVPRWPFSGVPMIQLKPGDTAVHLAGAGSFLLLGLHHVWHRRARMPLLGREWFWWACWLVGFALVATRNRGGMLAIFVAIAIAVLVRFWNPKIARVAFLATTAAFFLIIFDLQISLGRARAVSLEQLVINMSSVFGGSDATTANLAGSRQWRLNWWSDIVNYTFFGDYFWTGKGFGINLASSDGYQVLSGQKLRSPHNGHLTVLARAGVPGLFLWVVLQAGFALMLVTAFLRARRTGNPWWARANIWILSYWAAFMVNGAFDVFLEGPQGGIWFWSLFGFGIAFVEYQRRALRGVGPGATGGRL